MANLEFKIFSLFSRPESIHCKINHCVFPATWISCLRHYFPTIHFKNVEQWPSWHILSRALIIILQHPTFVLISHGFCYKWPHLNSFSGLRQSINTSWKVYILAYLFRSLSQHPFHSDKLPLV